MKKNNKGTLTLEDMQRAYDASSNFPSSEVVLTEQQVNQIKILMPDLKVKRIQ